jgi:ribosomal protein S18 acetylase RimI-like enzyme
MSDTAPAPENRAPVDMPHICSLRRLTFADIPAARDIDELSFSAGDQYELAFYERVVSSPDFEAMAAIQNNGAIAGWVLADLSRRPVRIKSVSVHPKCRRRGFGATLITSILNRHMAEIDLLVDRENNVAIALYQRLGFFGTDPDPEVPERLRMLRLPAKFK